MPKKPTDESKNPALDASIDKFFQRRQSVDLKKSSRTGKFDRTPPEPEPKELLQKAKQRSSGMTLDARHAVLSRFRKTPEKYGHVPKFTEHDEPESLADDPELPQGRNERVAAQLSKGMKPTPAPRTAHEIAGYGDTIYPTKTFRYLAPLELPAHLKQKLHSLPSVGTIPQGSKGKVTLNTKVGGQPVLKVHFGDEHGEHTFDASKMHHVEVKDKEVTVKSPIFYKRAQAASDAPKTIGVMTKVKRGEPWTVVDTSKSWKVGTRVRKARPTNEYGHHTITIQHPTTKQKLTLPSHDKDGNDFWKHWHIKESARDYKFYLEAIQAGIDPKDILG